ncbi:unnamed protein product [Diamesa serratosioi]
MTTAKGNLLHFIGLFLVVLNVCSAVKIHSVTVPSTYVLKSEEPNIIVLDCDYTADESESGFVLKWLLNNVVVYQWIPSTKTPFGVGSFKGRVDDNYTSSEDRLQKHRALVITKPLTSDSGDYACSIQTFQTISKLSAKMQIVDPEDSFDLTYGIDEESQMVNFQCTVSNVYPRPEMKFKFDSSDRDVQASVKAKLDEEVYDVSMTAQIAKSDLNDDSSVSCHMRIPNTDYTKEKTITYDGMN